MRKIIFIVVALFMHSIINAQTEKGHFVLGGDSNLGLNFASTTYKTDADGYDDIEGTKYNSINFKPIAGYFVVDNLALGLLASISSNTYKNDSYKSTSTSTAIGPFFRYYFPAGNVLPFITGQGVFGSMKYDEDGDGDGDEYEYEYKESLTSLGGGVGLAVPLSESVTFDIIAGYSSTTTKYSEDNPNNQRTVVGSFGVNLGFVVILGTGK